MSYEFKTKDDPESLPDQIAAYLNQYVQNRLDDFANIKTEDFDYLYLRDYCHKVIGSARSYNLYQLEEITLVLQEYARSQNSTGIKELLKDYALYIDDLAQKYLNQG